MFGYVIGQFVMFLLVAAIWLIITKLIPPLRRRPGISYGVAMVLVVLLALTQIGLSPSLAFTALAAVICEALLFWQYRRDRAKQAKYRESLRQLSGQATQPDRARANKENRTPPPKQALLINRRWGSTSRMSP